MKEKNASEKAVNVRESDVKAAALKSAIKQKQEVISKRLVVKK